MKKLITIPPTFKQFGDDHFGGEDYYFNSDPKEGKVGSGGGTVNLLYEASKHESATGSISNWLAKEKRLIIHAGGQSRRLPAYAAVGKVFTPMPIFRWKRGQRVNQTLIDQQIPLYEEILNKAPQNLNHLVASGDVLIRTEGALPEIPDADIVCFGLWEQPEKASNFGVFFSAKNSPKEMAFALQKPSAQKLQELQPNYLFFIDIGIWLFSTKAMELMFERSGWDKESNSFINGVPSFYDMYTEFGQALGKNPTLKDDAINKLTVAIVPLSKGEFYHFGTSAELIESTNKLQNLVKNQEEIWHNKIKPSADLFTQNAITKYDFTSRNSAIWVENSHIAATWKLRSKHIITGAPVNNWQLDLPEETCLDFIPVGNGDEWAVRVYGFYDPQLPKRGIDAGRPYAAADWFHEPVYPVFNQADLTGEIIQNLIDNPYSYTTQGKRLIAAADVADEVNLYRQYAQRESFLESNLQSMATNWKQSVFYQLDLKNAAQIYQKAGLNLPPALPQDAPLLTRLHDQMFRSEVLGSKNPEAAGYEARAFSLLAETIVETAKTDLAEPRLDVMSDQIVWGRSPIRLDLAGGWTDTPPNCLINGGKVLNLAIELNGQPPLQVFIKPSAEYSITLRSIDLGVKEDITTYKQLNDYNNSVGSAFCIPKAALCLAGFSPEFSAVQYGSLQEQLKEFGMGIEITLLAAIPKGSGLGTSSILASTVLGTLSDFCDLKWDKYTICSRTLVLEQMLTTGGGWQDQYGGVFGGIKLLESNPGIFQKPTVRWAPEFIFTDASAASVLLYYTGITRVAKNILAEIVKGMFLNGSNYLSILEEMNHHALKTYEAFQYGDLQQVAQATGISWELNQRLDGGTNTPETQAIINRISDYIISCKLLGAGGGGYMLIFAKDVAAASLVRNALNTNPLNNRARFVNWSISRDGFKVSRS
ncbi:bifunctional fucokinase/fucose-1-phosphate guanylyltransferase [Mucilaginibacter sp. FT3.2]|uniref:bifunctional fucokinase/fucose-1-phosphate guanylyltransferase n=1 Tax=Mucilaginibacter sp. FT3.2 TaxID=2723090 RepID=UPI001610A213|nr:bifunctional fucokinase/fucose-1-phosphate guanylyltransferase [Mucilaginibacter sp. FT3.2]MBB6233066.1 galactokinase/mevalonate kinase-like predicted kinase [Mucilaginibacter sp. FT3.2]